MKPENIIDYDQPPIDDAPPVVDEPPYGDPTPQNDPSGAPGIIPQNTTNKKKENKNEIL